MELPPLLRRAVDLVLEGVAPADLSAAAESLSARYRAELRDERFHLADDLAVSAYLAMRLPATYAAIRASLEAACEIRPGFAPRSLLDVGAGAALWGAVDRWPGLEAALLLEGSPVMRAWGGRLSAAAGVGRLRWRAADIATALPDAEPHDLVTLAYVLDELAPEKRGPLLDGLWRLTADLLVIVEPGTPAGWQRILAARARLLAAGAFVVAPCPHGAACPLHPPDWCHFAVRLARSRRHRQAKAAALSWEDEKFIYLAMSRQPVAPPAARVIARPQAGKGHVRLKLCRADGEAQQRVASRREGEDYRRARKLSWGSALMSQ